MALLKIVIWNTRAEMMNMMEADIPRKPLQHLRQFVEGTSLQGRRRVIPFLASLPIHPFKLMLNVEQPDACGTSHRGDDQLNQQVGLDSENPTEPSRERKNSQVRPIHRIPLSAAGPGGRKTFA